MTTPTNQSIDNCSFACDKLGDVFPSRFSRSVYNIISNIIDFHPKFQSQNPELVQNSHVLESFFPPLPLRALSNPKGLLRPMINCTRNRNNKNNVLACHCFLLPRKGSKSNLSDHVVPSRGQVHSWFAVHYVQELSTSTYFQGLS